MVEPLRHRQTKGAATDMFDLQPPRHISTLPIAAHSKVSTLRQLSGAKRKYGSVMPALAICIANEQMIVNHRARVWVGPSRHPL
jgi:hypothetical protein